MTEPSNPYAPPASGWDASTGGDLDPGELGPVLRTLSALSPDKKNVPWSITLHERHARFVEDADGDGRRFVVSRAEFPERVGLAIFDQAVLTIPPPDKVALRTPVEHAREIKDWLGPGGDAWLAALLKQRRRFGGITLAVLALFALLDRSPFLIGYVAVSGVLLLLSRVAPTRHLFLADAVVSLAFGVYFSWGIYQGTLSGWWALFLLLVAFSVPLNVRLFKFFGRGRAQA
jgi:hypothetical protein